MTTVSPKEFGQVIANVQHLMEGVNKHVENTAKEMEKIHQRIDDHMDKEEKERKEMIALMAMNAEASQKRHEEIQTNSAARFKKIEDTYSKAIWIFGGMCLTLPFIGTLLMVILKMAFTYFMPESGLADLFSLLYDSIPYYG